MTEEEKAHAFRVVRYFFSAKRPVLPNDFRRWGITTYREARKFLEEFNEHSMKDGMRWLIEEKPFKCRVVDPATGDESDGAVTGFYGQLDWAYRRSE